LAGTPEVSPLTACGTITSLQLFVPGDLPVERGSADRIPYAAPARRTRFGRAGSALELVHELFEPLVVRIRKFELVPPGGGDDRSILTGYGAHEDLVDTTREARESVDLMRIEIGQIGDPHRAMFEGVKGILGADGRVVEAAVRQDGVMRSTSGNLTLRVDVAGDVLGRTDGERFGAIGDSRDGVGVEEHEGDEAKHHRDADECSKPLRPRRFAWHGLRTARRGG